MNIQDNPVRSKIIALVPDCDLDEARYARKVRALATSMHMDVLFLSMVRSDEREASIRRRLITLAGIANINPIKASFATSHFPTWIEIASKEFNTGDYVMYPAEIEPLISDDPRNESLQSQYGSRACPVYGMITSSTKERMEYLTRQILEWVGIIVIIIGAFLLEAGFDLQVTGWIRTLVEISLLALEIGFLWFWHFFISKLHY
ncbi:hypothetical protein [Leptolinea tardivitalis]|uniref:Uncharacterized protein n=1 Tax=Leptolinea tardivitalis TaxID=229920 RepID=A0A0P6WRG7_9CHLR|nr:hypothetical protein [Leptolinea tardivitalis]KPL72685.1 hypothetical protein ADM99_06250 [Leptolinea tardivitalis]GAP20976.1 hypothetical protein LTAR_01180 [Leptolinea tardivitalis]